jgi:IS5 family transposase
MNSHAVILKLASALDLDIPEDTHRTGPRLYSLKSLAKALLFRHLLRLSSDRDLARKLQNFSELRNACGLKKAPHATTLGRARDRIDIAGIFYQLVQTAKQYGLSRGFILTVDSTQFEAYLKGDKDAKVGYCAAKDEFIFGYKAHIVTDAKSELPVAVVLTPANDHDSRQFLPLMRRVLRNFSYEIKKLLADSGYDAAYIRRWLRDHQIADVIDRNKRGGTNFGKPKDPDYRRRAASERLNSHAKDGFALERFYLCRLRESIAAHIYLPFSNALFSNLLLPDRTEGLEKTCALR